MQDREGEANVLDDEGVEADGGIVDVAESHGEGVDEEEEGVAGVEPASIWSEVSLKLEKEGEGCSLLIDVDAICAHEREIELDRLEVENLEVDVAGARSALGLGDLLRLVGEFAAG